MLGAAVIGVVLFLLSRNTQSTAAEASNTIEGIQVFQNISREHTNDIVLYDHIPPAGGAHNPTWLNCGVYGEPVPNENAVHSLEHGAIWITYQPGLPAGDLSTLQTLTRQSGYRLLSPFPGIASPIVLSAWGYQLGVDNANDPRIFQFIQAFEQNPFGPEPGAPCTGGTGTPS